MNSVPCFVAAYHCMQTVPLVVVAYHNLQEQ
jgi:hypothetical protein